MLHALNHTSQCFLVLIVFGTVSSLHSTSLLHLWYIQIVDYMLKNSTADFMRSRIQDNTTHDPKYYLKPMVFGIQSDYGTSHLCVLAPNGDAVAATSTINN